MKKISFLIILSSAALCFDIEAQSINQSINQSNEIVAALGSFDTTHRRSQKTPYEIRFEYRWKNPFFWRFRPLAGIIVTNQQSIYPYASMMCESDLFHNISCSASLGAGFYKKGNGFSLGGTLNFKSQFEVWWHVKPRIQLGLAFSHLSHASLNGQPRPRKSCYPNKDSCLKAPAYKKTL